MNNVIPLYITDELTGLQVPNRGYPAEYMVVDQHGYAHCIQPTRDAAIAWTYRHPSVSRQYHIEEFPAFPPKTLDTA